MHQRQDLVLCFWFFPSSFQFEIRQLRAHLAQQDLDLVAEREAAMQIHHMWGKQSSAFQEVDGLASGPSERHRPARSREPGRPAGTRLPQMGLPKNKLESLDE